MLISKRKYLNIGHFTLFLDGKELEEVDYLGVLIKNDLHGQITHRRSKEDSGSPL
jgi:hypothetical protein